LEPLAQRLAHDGIAGGLDPTRGFPPVKIAIEALDQLIGEADTEDTRTLLLFTRHDVFLWKEKALQNVIQESIPKRARSAKHPVWDPSQSGRLQSPLVARMSWPGLTRAGCRWQQLSLLPLLSVPCQWGGLTLVHQKRGRARRSWRGLSSTCYTGTLASRARQSPSARSYCGRWALLSIP